MKTRIVLFSLLVAAIFYLSTRIYSAYQCPSDDALARIFMKNRARLDQLQSMIESDGGRVSYIGYGIVEASGAPLSLKRKMEYLSEIKEIGAICVYQNIGEIKVFFWGDGVSIASRERSKGLIFFPEMEKCPYTVRTRLDGLEKPV